MLWGFGWGAGGREFHPGSGWPASVPYPPGTFPGVVFHHRNSLGHCALPHPPREDITYRLPELDPRGSDEENLDSETSASTESLLEERAGRGASEGQY